jgi:hypothetical protein
MSPCALTDGADAPGLVDELVPGLATVSDDIVVAVEDSVGEPVVAEELPDVLDRVELGRPRWQWQEGDVVGHNQLPGNMPARLVEQEHGMGPGCYRAADLEEMGLHRFGVAPGHDEPGALSLGRADGPEDVGPFGALVVRCPRPSAATGPAAGDLVLLADPGLIREPDLYQLAWGRGLRDLRQAGGEVFLNASIVSGSCA